MITVSYETAFAAQPESVPLRGRAAKRIELKDSGKCLYTPKNDRARMYWFAFLVPV